MRGSACLFRYSAFCTYSCGTVVILPGTHVCTQDKVETKFRSSDPV